jgi:predicted permease
VLSELFAIVVPVYLCAGAGYAWVRMGRRYDSEGITDLIMMVGAPCLVFSSIATLEMERALVLEMAAAILVAVAIMGIIAALLLRLLGLSVSNFIGPLTMPNTGNMGLPIIFFAFGAEGLALGVVIFAILALLQFTVMVWFWTGRVSFAELLRSPLAWAATLAALGVFFEVKPPEFIQRFTTLLGSFTIPLMQFTLGASLARLEIARIPRTAVLAAFRLLIGFGVGVGVAELFGLEGVARGVLILDCAMPVAVINYLFAERYGRSANEVASTVVLSTLFSFATIPLILLWLL